jgi:hypothetical protein
VTEEDNSCRGYYGAGELVELAVWCVTIRPEIIVPNEKKQNRKCPYSPVVDGMVDVE